MISLAINLVGIVTIVSFLAHSSIFVPTFKLLSFCCSERNSRKTTILSRDKKGKGVYTGIMY
eukprot:snap_masked-scaffold_3-processed-gene-10.45-mRNA-1 protein AED:1.00 eAED:1.00 QI:0/0/0/0/1/1/2/0/61